MSLPSYKEPAYYKTEISDEEKKKLEKIFDIIEKDIQAYEFLNPVDYIGLNILDYPKIITHPMDLGTAKKNLVNGNYKIIQDFMNDINLIWQNCRVYNLPGSDIVKMANHCDKRFRQLLDKQFKNYKTKGESTKSKNNNSTLTLSEKTKLIKTIKEQPNESLTQIVKIILRECPKGIEDIDNEKLQIKIDLIDYRTYELINQYLEKNNNENTVTNNEKGKSTKK